MALLSWLFQVTFLPEDSRWVENGAVGFHRV